MFIIELFKYLCILAMGMILNNVLSKSIRIFLFPYIIAILFTIFIVNRFASSMLVFYSSRAVIMCGSAFLLNFSFKNYIFSSVEKIFIVFWSYFCLVNIFIPSGINVLTPKIIFIISFFGVGVMAGRYIVEQNQLRRTVNITAIATLFVCYLYATILVSNMNIYAMDERLGEEGLNPNLIGLMIVSVLPFCFMATFFIENPFWMRGITAFASIYCIFIIFLTGSRNSFFAAAVAFFGIILSVPRRKTLTAFLSIVFIFLFYYFVSKRIDVIHSRIVSDLTTETGRTSYWINQLNFQTIMERIFGSGPIIDQNINGPRWANGHSMFFQIFYETGYVGSILFLVYLFIHVKRALQVPYYGAVALSLLVTVLACGMGESYPLQANAITTLLWGISIGLLATITHEVPPHSKKTV